MIKSGFNKIDDICEFWEKKAYQKGEYVENVDHFNHTFLHAMKALGKIASAMEELGHLRVRPIEKIEPLGKLYADLAICAARMAKLDGMSLEEEIIKRIKEKR